MERHSYIILILILIILPTNGMPPATAAGKKPLILRIMGLRQAAVHIEPDGHDEDDVTMMKLTLMMVLVLGVIVLVMQHKKHVIWQTRSP